MSKTMKIILYALGILVIVMVIMHLSVAHGKTQGQAAGAGNQGAGNSAGAYYPPGSVGSTPTSGTTAVAGGDPSIWDALFNQSQASFNQFETTVQTLA